MTIGLNGAGRRELAIFIVLLVALSSVIGGWYWYAHSSERSRGTIVWYAAMLESEWELYKPIVDEFTEETRIDVEVVLYGNAWDELSNDLRNDVGGNEHRADVVTVDDFDVIELEPYTYDMSEEIASWGQWDSVHFEKRNICEAHGGLHFMPWRADCLTMFVNTTALDNYDLGVPGTMEDLLDVARALSENGSTGPVGFKSQMYEGLTCEIAVFIRAYGGNYLTFNSTENTAAFRFLDNLSAYAHPGSKGWNEGNITDALNRGEIFIDFNWPYQLSTIKGAGLSGSIKPFPTPWGSVGRGTTLGGGYLAISNASEKKEMAWEFIEFLASKRGQGMQLSRVGWLPMRDDAWDYLEQANPSRYTELNPFRETLKYGLARPIVQNYTEFSDLWQSAFWDVVWNGEPVVATLDHYQGEWESIQST